jgi:membrane fusion protein, heavy metal efflux system
VLRIFRRGGEAVDGTPQTPVMEIADVSMLELRADAAARDLARLTAGTSATVAFDAMADTTATGTLVVVAPAVDPATALGQVRLALAPVAETRLVVGQTATATITLAAHDAVVVPPTALRRSGRGADEVVVCVGDPAKAEVREVEVGTRLPDAVELSTGVAAGDRVVIDHALGLSDGQPLEEGK